MTTRKSTFIFSRSEDGYFTLENSFLSATVGQTASDGIWALTRLVDKRISKNILSVGNLLQFRKDEGNLYRYHADSSSFSSNASSSSFSPLHFFSFLFFFVFFCFLFFFFFFFLFVPSYSSSDSSSQSPS